MYSQDAEAATENVEDPTTSPILNVRIETSFPASEIFGIKVVNGQPTEAHLSVSNDEPDPVMVSFIGGSLWSLDSDPQGSRIVRNLTTTRLNTEVPAGQKESIVYRFATELHPQDLRLNLATVMADAKGNYFTLQAFNSTVSIVEPDTSIFDPQIIFLYFFIAACFAGVVYFFYNIWIAPYFPQKKGKGGERAKKSSGGSKKVDPSDQLPVIGGDGPAVTSGAKAYNEDWIPAHHIQRPEAKRVKSGGPRPKSRNKNAE